MDLALVTFGSLALNLYLPEISYPKILKMSDPVLETLLKMQSHPAAHPL